MKQTAVEWLIKKLQNRQNGIFDGLPHLSLDEIYEQAKAMEKEQIIESWDNGFSNGYDLGKYNDDCNPDDGEQYYNETYGGNDHIGEANEMVSSQTEISELRMDIETAEKRILRLFNVSGLLPTDEDISKKAQEARLNDINDSINRVGGFIVGATWMRDLLKGNDHIGEANEMV